jgi:hypothetical protein
MSKEGKILDSTSPRETIRQHQENAEWMFREEAVFWYGVSQIMDERFFNGLVYPDGRKVPAPFIAFEDLRNKNTIAQYDLFPDEYGIVGKITFNTAHYKDTADENGKPVKLITMIRRMKTVNQLRFGKGVDTRKEKRCCMNTFTCGSRLVAEKIHIGGSSTGEKLIIESGTKKRES